MTSELVVRNKSGVFVSETPPRAPVFVGRLQITHASGVLASDADTAYFWTPEWQAGEREADEDIREGRLTRFDDADAAIRHLREL